MADIDVSTELEKILEAVYGEEVRGSIHDAIKKMADIIKDRVIDVDDTFTVSGAAADAKAVGDKTFQIKGDLASGTDLNSVTSPGIYKLKVNGNYTSSPLEEGGRGWLVVYAYGNEGVSLTQQVIEGGTDNKTYYTHMRHRRVSGSTFIWSVWQKNRSDTDDTLTIPGMPADAKVVGDTTLRFKGVIDDRVDFNNIWGNGIYRISSARQYSHMPIDNGKTGWLLVYQYGSTGISITQYVFESGISSKKTYMTYMRSANTTNYPYTWGEWQTSSFETDETLSKSGEAADAKVVGDKFKDLEYEPVDILTFSASPSEAEIGASVNQVTFTYKINQIPVTLTLAGSSITPKDQGTEVKAGLNLRTTTSWELVAKDAGSPSNPVATDRASASLTFKNKVYWGASAIPSNVNSAFINGLSGALATSRAREFTTTPGANQYIWFASPTSFGACTFKDKATGLTGGFNLIGTVQHTNASGGGPTAYYVYRSVQPNLGNTTIIVS